MKTTFTFYHLLLVTTLLLSACSDSSATSNNDSSDVDTKSQSSMSQSDIQELDWMDLMPRGEDEVLEKLYAEYYADLNKQASENDNGFNLDNVTEGAANDTMDQIGTFNVVKELNKRKVRIPGYVVPLDFNAESAYTEFLLVPYFGACLHTPPPPPNQIIFVNSETATQIVDINQPVWLEGILKTGEFNSDLANTAYELTLSKLEPYDY